MPHGRSRRSVLRGVGGVAVALSVGPGVAQAQDARLLAAAAEIGRALARSPAPAGVEALDPAHWAARLRAGASVAATLDEVRRAAAHDFAAGAVIDLCGARLARAEAAFAIACRERLAGGRP